jgi:hypothetical protein
MALEIVEKLLPVGREIVKFIVPQRKRKAVVDADQCGRILGEPFGDAAPGSVFARARRRQDFDRRRSALGEINAQALQARGRRLCA